MNDFENIVYFLKVWREEDQEDKIVLSRHEIITLLEGIEELKHIEFMNEIT